jgi:hypothetical protein
MMPGAATHRDFIGAGRSPRGCADPPRRGEVRRHDSAGACMTSGVDDGGLDHLMAAATLLGLDIRPEWRAGVRANLRVSLDFGALVGGFPLPDETEPAPVFVA